MDYNFCPLCHLPWSYDSFNVRNVCDTCGAILSDSRSTFPCGDIFLPIKSGGKNIDTICIAWHTLDEYCCYGIYLNHILGKCEKIGWIPFDMEVVRMYLTFS